MVPSDSSDEVSSLVCIMAMYLFMCVFCIIKSYTDPRWRGTPKCVLKASEVFCTSSEVYLMFCLHKL